MARANTVESVKRLLGLTQRSADADPPQDQAAHAGRVLEAIFNSLGPVIGAAGVRATFERSLKLNMAAYPFLKEVATGGSAQQPTNEDVAHRFTGCLSELQPALAATVATSLYTTFFDLMSNLIGEELLWQILKTPRLALDETDAEEKE
jgi:hypothetical protein